MSMRVIMIVLAVLLTGGCSSKQDLGQAQAAIAMFHSDYNRGDHARIYAESSPRLKRVVSEEKLTHMLSATRTRLGKHDGGTVGNWRVNYHPSGTTVSIELKSHYLGGAQAVEQFQFADEDKRMRLTGYHISSDAFIP
jgi:hypothetical protein